jgi:hypothetical protein
MPATRLITTAAELKLGDIVRHASLDNPDATDEGFNDATVVRIDDRDVTLFRPYVHTGDFAYGSTVPGEGKVLNYIGFEEYRIPKNDPATFRVLYRCKNPIL